MRALVSDRPRPDGVDRDRDGGTRERERDQDAPVAVSLEDVTKRYAETTAVDGVSLAVHEGEFFTFVGPSGCGKTTTLRLIAGFESPTTGTVRFDGADVTGVPPEDRDVGVVFQNYALFPHMTVGENVSYGLNFTDAPGNVSENERVAELLELIDLEGFEDREPDQLSGGQQQRVAIARALAPGPDVLLLDEPMSALDAQLRERLRLQVKAIQQELDITTIYVTHDQEEALAISDRVAVMRDGRPEQVATPQTIYRRPRTRFVADFIGDNNVFTGTVTAVDRGPDGAKLATLEVGPERFVVDIGDRRLSSGDEVTVCVRPEHLRIDGAADRAGGPGEAATNATNATVESAEFLGEQTRVHLDWHGRHLLARTSEPPSGRVTIGFDPDGPHVIEIS